MNCMKCGRETSQEQCFCEDCLLEMEKYPVRPGTAIQLPLRSEAASARKVPKRRSASLEEQLKLTRKRLRVVTIALAVAAVLCAALAYPAVAYLAEDHFAIGQNYSSMTTPSDGS